jgi:CRISPR-associated endonuclease Csn1
VTTILGLDIGSNSVGSAWVDTENRSIRVGVSVFPSGVEEKDDGRGAPKNQKRREKRSLRRSFARKSARKRKLRGLLKEQGLFPSAPHQIDELMRTDAWQLRAEGLSRDLTPFEFGRVLLHMCQRRGALGLKLRESEEHDATGKSIAEADEDGKVKEAIDATRKAIQLHNVATFGELMATLAKLRRTPVMNLDGKPKLNASGLPITFSHKIRNELGNFEFHADRQMLRDEFNKLWETQIRLQSELSSILTEDLKLKLDNPTGDAVWRHRGLLFGQRRTYWKTGTLGRCKLEPTDECVSIADRHASLYRVLETVNNIRIRGPQEHDFRPLYPDERQKVIDRLRVQKSGTVATVRDALGIGTKLLKKAGIPPESYSLNLERDEDREINTDWFYKAIVLEGIGETAWEAWDENKREGMNRAILRFDPSEEIDTQKFASVAQKLGVDSDKLDGLLAQWRTRPKLEKRLKLSRRAVLNLLPYMDRPDSNGHWPTQIEARMRFANDANATDRTSKGQITLQQRERYSLGSNRLNKRDRHYLKKHPETVLPPAPMLTNPVVRKAIHEVRRHVIAHIRAAGRKPDRIVIEFARETTKTAKQNDQILARNRFREKYRREIRENIIRAAFGSMYDSLSTNQLRAAEDRIILCEQQEKRCAYSGTTITPMQAALGHGLEIDHIIPYSRCGNNSLNNRVLCYRESNRNKLNQTPREWWKGDFDEHIQPMRFMDGVDKKQIHPYFSKRDYAKKWENLSAENVLSEWKGNQLSDTAYAAKEVEVYLQQSLWPDEPSFLAGDTARRIYVTKGAYTSQLRRDWQLYRKRSVDSDNRFIRDQLTAKDRGDHREHAIDAVAIAFTDGSRINTLAAMMTHQQNEWIRAKNQGSKPERIKRKPIDPPWGDILSFRRQVLSLIYDDFDDDQENGHPRSDNHAIVVSHRPVGRKLAGRFHEDSLFGSVPHDKKLYTGAVRVADLTPNHLRMPVPEKQEEAISRLADRYLKSKTVSNPRDAKKIAKEFVASKAYVPRLVDPPPGKTGLIRDVGLRMQVRTTIEDRLRRFGIDRTADTFTSADLKKILNPIDPDTGRPQFSPLTMKSGIPIKRMVLLRAMNDPVIVARRRWNEQTRKWEIDQSKKASRAYVGGNNHHIEIRSNEKGEWSGEILSMYEAARRARVQKTDPVDRTSNPTRGGAFVMSLAEGETVYMRHKQTGVPGYFVVVKLVKPATIEFKAHWDARRATGEKNEQGELITDSARVSIPVSAAQLAGLAAPGEVTPIKVVVNPLGQIQRVEPLPSREDRLAEVDPRILLIAREAVAARRSKNELSGSSRKRKHGSWSWMRARLKREKLEHLAAQVSVAVRLLDRENN